MLQSAGERATIRAVTDRSADDEDEVRWLRRQLVHDGVDPDHIEEMVAKWPFGRSRYARMRDDRRRPPGSPTRLWFRAETGSDWPLWLSSGDQESPRAIEYHPELRRRLEAWALEYDADEVDEADYLHRGRELCALCDAAVRPSYEVIWDSDDVFAS